ncbi:MAG: SDR family oxidoreductase [Terriglobales bacterium]
MSQLLPGKVAFVTGASSGIGRASALLFAKEGAKVVVADVNVQGGQETVAQIKANGGEALFAKTDVSSEAEVKAAIERTVAAYGCLDCAHNNAAILGPVPTRLMDLTEERWDRVLNINLKGVWLCMKYQIAQMLKQGGGAIVNTSSSLGLRGGPGAGAYSASKHGVLGLTKAAALEVAKQGIRVNAVCPGAIDTPMGQSVPNEFALAVAAEPIGRAGRPEEIAQAVIWLCSDKASFMVGHAMAVDGGLTLP